MTRLYIGDNVPDDPEFDPEIKKRYWVTCQVLIEAYHAGDALLDAEDWLKENTGISGENPKDWETLKPESAVEFLDLA